MGIITWSNWLTLSNDRIWRDKWTTDNQTIEDQALNNIYIDKESKLRWST